jgi:hypothetical protein
MRLNKEIKEKDDEIDVVNEKILELEEVIKEEEYNLLEEQKRQEKARNNEELK